MKLNKVLEINCLNEGSKKYYPMSLIIIEQLEKGKSVAMFEDPAEKP